MKAIVLNKVRIHPSILTADFSKLGEQFREAESCGADGIHIDIMDGHFVEPITFGPLILQNLREITSLDFDVHMMVENPSKYFDDLVNVGADSITIHYEACESLTEILGLLEQLDVRTSVAINPQTNVDELFPYLNRMDQAVVMSVNPGYGGQTFIEDTLEKISSLKQYIEDHSFDVDIQVDGGINERTARKAVLSGADILVAGSAVFNQNFSVCDGIKAIRHQIRVCRKSDG